MTVLITGGNGFVGLHLAEALLARGERVVAFDRSIAAAERLGAAPAPGDVRDADAVRDAMRRHAVTHVVHAAVITAGVERERSAARDIIGSICWARRRCWRLRGIAAWSAFFIPAR
ncbi:MAG: hypothetical protein NVS3B2_02400 [Ramlibacter sp.]